MDENLKSQSSTSKFKQGDYKIGFNVVYVKKWMKTKHAIMFRLSNKIVQVRLPF